MEGSSSSCSSPAPTIIPLPDWASAVKAISGNKSVSATLSLTEEGCSTSSPMSSFMEAMNLLVKLYQAFGSAVASEEIRKLVDAFSSKIVQIYTQTTSESKEVVLKVTDFSCPICFEVVEEALTVRCGHSYCKKCLQREVTLGGECRVCSYRLTSVDFDETRPNVLLIAIADKLWPDHKKAVGLRSEGNELFKLQRFHEALQKYTEAIELNPSDHISLCNRAHTLWILDQHMTALEDAELAIMNCPFWFKSYFRKAAILDSLGRYEDAFCTLTLCIYLIKITKSPDESVPINSVKEEMAKVLLKMFSSALTAAQLSLRRKNYDSSSYSPYPEQKRKCNRRMGGGGLGGVCEDHSAPVEFTSFPMPDDIPSSFSAEIPQTPYSSYSSSFNELSPFPHHHQHQYKCRVVIPPPPPLFPTYDPVATRLHHIFTLAVQEVSKFGRQTIFHQRPVNESLIAPTDFECSLCYRLLYQPVTTICGHTYCRSCLERCLDHAPTCPLCKTSLESSVAYRRYAITYILEQLICRLLPKEHRERVNQHMEELAECCQSGQSKETEIPIFVCTMAFPTIPCNLHVFEPRYRLMIRRCMESGSKKFGMCCYLQDGTHNYGDFGTTLEIRNVQYFPDGRSVLSTVGGKRFKVLKKAMKDGYNVATIEYLEDKPIDETTIPRLREVHESVLKDSNEWLQSIDNVVRQRIITHFGNMPSAEENWLGIPGGPAWTWWLLAILPLDAKAQSAILSMTTLLKRLESLQKVLSKVRNLT